MLSRLTLYRVRRRNLQRAHYFEAADRLDRSLAAMPGSSHKLLGYGLNVWRTRLARSTNIDDERIEGRR